MQWFPLGSDRAKEVDFGIGSDAYSCLGAGDSAVYRATSVCDIERRCSGESLAFNSGLVGTWLGGLHATDANGKALRMICSICDHWRASLSKEAMV